MLYTLTEQEALLKKRRDALALDGIPDVFAAFKRLLEIEATPAPESTAAEAAAEPVAETEEAEETEETEETAETAETAAAPETVAETELEPEESKSKFKEEIDAQFKKAMNEATDAEKAREAVTKKAKKLCVLCERLEVQKDKDKAKNTVRAIENAYYTAIERKKIMDRKNAITAQFYYSEGQQQDGAKTVSRVGAKTSRSKIEMTLSKSCATVKRLSSYSGKRGWTVRGRSLQNQDLDKLMEHIIDNFDPDKAVKLNQGKQVDRIAIAKRLIDAGFKVDLRVENKLAVRRAIEKYAGDRVHLLIRKEAGGSELKVTQAAAEAEAEAVSGSGSPAP